MGEIGAFEAKNRLGQLLDLAERGEVVVITRHGRPVARLVPNAGAVDRSQARAAAARVRLRSASLSTGTFDWESLKRDRDEGRP